MKKEELEELLIRSVHSDEAATKFFMENLDNIDIFSALINIVQTSESGDARMKGAFFISKSNKELLENVEDVLLVLMDDEWDSVAVHIMIALSRIKSLKAIKKSYKIG